MDPFAGQRWRGVRLEHLAWHAFSGGVLGLLLLILLVSVNSLGEPVASVKAGPPAQIAVPVEIEPVERGRDHTRVRLPGVADPYARVELGGSWRSNT